MMIGNGMYPMPKWYVKLKNLPQAKKPWHLNLLQMVTHTQLYIVYKHYMDRIKVK